MKFAQVYHIRHSLILRVLPMKLRNASSPLQVTLPMFVNTAMQSCQRLSKLNPIKN